MKPVLSFNNAALRNAGLVALLLLLLQCILAVVYYRERMLFTDASRILFHSINTGEIVIAERRWGSIVTGWVPVVLSKLHLPLWSILVAYSLSFPLSALGVGSLLFFRFREYAFTALLACYHTLFVSAAFFWTNTEIHQAVSWMFLALGFPMYLYRRGAVPLLFWSMFAVLSAMAIATHPLCGPLYLFLWVFAALDRRILPLSRREAIVGGGMLLLMVVVKLAVSAGQGYDGRRMSEILHPPGGHFWDILGMAPARLFARQLELNYLPGALLFLAGVVLLLRAGRWLQALLTLCAAPGLLLMVWLAFSGYGGFHYYLEGEWQGLGLIAVAPAVYYLLPALRPRIAVVAIILLFSLRTGAIIWAGEAFRYRVRYIAGMLDKMRSKGLTKVALRARDGCPEGVLLMDWGLATESITLSALDGEYPQRTVCAVWPDQIERIPKNGKAMIWNFDTRPVAALNARYFAIDTTGPYVVMGYEELME